MECKICFGSFTKHNNLTCNHNNLFCQECLDRWDKKMCPYCKKHTLKWNEYCLINIDDQYKIMIEDSISNLTEEDFQYLSSYNPPANTGFIFDKNPDVKKITKKICNSYDGHSGCSMAFTMRWLQSQAILYYSYN